MQLQTNLVRRKSHFYFRTRIPTDLKSHYGKTEILISLKTSDKRIADYELAKLKVKLYAEFGRLRASQSEKRESTILEVHTARKRLFKITGAKYANQVVKKTL